MFARKGRKAIYFQIYVESCGTHEDLNLTNSIGIFVSPMAIFKGKKRSEFAHSF
jgi:hypothetical protein